MEIETAMMHYENAQKRIEVIKVLVQPEEIVRTYRAAAAEMREAGDYLDAAMLAESYDKMAVEAEKEGKEKIYQKGCRQMENMQDEMSLKLAAMTFGRISGYKDADELAKRCEMGAERQKKRGRMKEWLLGVVFAFVLLLLIILVFFMERRAETDTAMKGRTVNESIVCDTAGL